MKKFIALFLALTMSMSLVACGSSGESKEPEAKGSEITVVTSYGGDDGNRTNYETAIADYEAATGNTVLDASSTSNEEWKAKVLTDFEAGTEPDVLFYFNNADSNPIVEGGKVVSLDEIRAEYPDFATNMKDELLVPSGVDNKVYSVPVNGFWEGLFTNKAVLKEAGVELPGADYTWDQFLADCQKIKDAGFTPIAVSLHEVPHYWFEFVAFNEGNLGNHLDVPTSADDATAQKWISGLDKLTELYELGYLPVNTLTATDAETVQLVADGEAAFLIDGSWKVGYFQENCADNLDDFALTYVPGNGDRKATDLIGGISMGYYITRKAWEDPAKREAAVKFVEHMTSDEVVSIFSATSVTALKNGVIPSDSLDPIQVSAIEMCAGTTGLVGAVQDTLSSEARTDLFANVKNIVTGKMTASEALESALSK